MSRRRLGVCSWSLQPASPAELVERVGGAGLGAVQIALDPLRTSPAWRLDATQRALRDAGLELLSGMMATEGEDYSTLDAIRLTGGVRPDRHWPANRAAARENAELARALGVRLVTFHAGFLPEERASRERSVLLERLREIAEIFAACGVGIALETGQETAATLLDALEDLDRRVGVNFDPANLLLYGMDDPASALERLAPHIRQIHVKDAIPCATRGAWGAEVPVGTGVVGWEALLPRLESLGVDCDLVIEREAGESRVRDVATARELVTRTLGAPR